LLSFSAAYFASHFAIHICKNYNIYIVYIYIYTHTILSNVSYGYETRSLTLREKYTLKVLIWYFGKQNDQLRVFENMVLREILQPKRDEVTREWRKLHNEELHDLYSPTKCYSGNQIQNNKQGGACST